MYLHCTNVRIKRREDDTSCASAAEHLSQNDVNKLVTLKIVRAFMFSVDPLHGVFDFDVEAGIFVDKIKSTVQSRKRLVFLWLVMITRDFVMQLALVIYGGMTLVINMIQLRD